MTRLPYLLILTGAAAAAQTVEGSVVNSVTGNGVAGAEVELHQGRKKPYSTTTDAEGRFRIEEVRDGAYTADYRAGGYSPPDPDSAGTRPFQVTTGGNPVKLEARLMPLGRIVGRVMGGGKAVANAQVELSAPGLLMVPADADGRFELDELFPGAYTVSAVPPAGWKPPDPEPDTDRVFGWTRTYYPGVALQEAATPIVLAPGGETSIELKLLAVTAHAVRGVLLNPDGSPAPKVAIHLGEDTLLAPEYHAESKADGSFEFPAAVDGEWRLSAVVDGSGGLKWWAGQWIEMAGHEVEGVKLRLSPPFTVRGKVVMEAPEGVPVPAPPSVGLDPHVSRVRREAFPVFRGLSPFVLGMVTQPDADGNFSMQYVYPGAYRIATTDAPAGYYLDSVRVGDAEPSMPEVEIAGPLAISLVHKTNGGTVRGTVENCRSGQVLLVPEDPAMRRPGFFRWAPCGGAAGADRYEVGAVRPGDYYVMALASGGVTPRPVIALAIAGKFDALLNQAERVQVRAGEASSADLKAITRLAY